MTSPQDASAFDDTVLFETNLARIGAFRCDSDHPAFDHSDPIANHCVWFSRRPVEIQPEHERAFVANGHTATFYNRTECFGRRAVGAFGDYSDWFALEEAVAQQIVEASAPAIRGQRRHPFAWSHVLVGAQTYLQQRRLFEAVASGPPPDQLMIEEGIVLLVEQAINDAVAADAKRQRVVIRPSHRDLVHETERLLTGRPEEALSLNEVAAHVGTSVYHLCRVFRRITGTTIHQYRLQLRLRATLEAIRDPLVSVTEIAARFGFPSHSRFTGAFRREFGALPSTLRRSA
jgi:AraC-like DNA-binding protein